MLALPSHGQGMPDCKVIDFGLTHRVDQPSYDLFGTPSYVAPELIAGTSAFTIKADIWSVGVTACELLASMAPFGSPENHGGDVEPVLQKVRNFARFQDIESRLCGSQSWMSRSSAAKIFVKTLVIKDPAHRPQADQALNHAWLNQAEHTSDDPDGCCRQTSAPAAFARQGSMVESPACRAQKPQRPQGGRTRHAWLNQNQADEQPGLVRQVTPPAAFTNRPSANCSQRGALCSGYAHQRSTK